MRVGTAHTIYSMCVDALVRARENSRLLVAICERESLQWKKKCESPVTEKDKKTEREARWRQVPNTVCN